MPVWSKILNDLPSGVIYEEINCDSNDGDKGIIAVGINTPRGNIKIF